MVLKNHQPAEAKSPGCTQPPDIVVACVKNVIKIQKLVTSISNLIFAAFLSTINPQDWHWKNKLTRNVCALVDVTKRIGILKTKLLI